MAALLVRVGFRTGLLLRAGLPLPPTRSVRALRRRPVTDAPRTAPGTQPCRTPGTGTRVPNTGTGPRSPDPGATGENPSARDQLHGLRFEKARAGDKRLAKVVSVARSRAFREKQGKVLLEGRRLICDALAAGAAPQMLFFSRVERLCELPLDKLRQASLVKVKSEDIKIWSDVVAPQGVIAIFSKPDASSLSFPKYQRLQTIPLFLICDSVRDPGHLGTILRCAAAAGCDRVLLTKGCVDAWEPKVIRAAMGAHFRIPILPGLDWSEIPELLPKTVTVCVAENDSVSPDQNPGDEGPTCNRDNSKNTQEEYVESDSDADDEVSLPRVEPKVYHENWAQRSTALVISGETHGPSPEALQLARETSGHKLFVPMAPGAKGLNSAMTASILLFEGRRQLLRLAQKTSRRGRPESSFHSS